MPRPIPCVAAVEAELTADELQAVREWVRRSGLPRGTAWTGEVPCLMLVENAIGRYCERLQMTRRARSLTHARQLAAGHFGIEPDTIGRNARRRRKKAGNMSATDAGRRLNFHVSPVGGLNGERTR